MSRQTLSNLAENSRSTTQGCELQTRPEVTEPFISSLRISPKETMHSAAKYIGIKTLNTVLFIWVNIWKRSKYPTIGWPTIPCSQGCPCFGSQSSTSWHPSVLSKPGRLVTAGNWVNKLRYISMKVSDKISKRCFSMAFFKIPLPHGLKNFQNIERAWQGTNLLHLE